MRVRVQHAHEVCVVAVEGEVDASATEFLAEAVRDAADSGDDVLLDLCAADCIHSTALAAVFAGHRRTVDNGARFAVASCGGHVARVLELAGAEWVIAVFPDRDRAVTWLAEPAVAG
jgi:anti-anti-sigma factor